MKIISFAETTPALLASHKTVTRRQWNDRYAETFQAGELVQAYDRNPRNGGKRVAIIRLADKPRKWPLLPKADFVAEGFQWMIDQDPILTLWGKDPREIWGEWSRSGATDLWVVRFTLQSVETT